VGPLTKDKDRRPGFEDRGKSVFAGVFLCELCVSVVNSFRVALSFP